MKITHPASLVIFLVVIFGLAVWFVSGVGLIALARHNYTMLQFSHQLLTNSNSESVDRNAWLNIAHRLEREVGQVPENPLLHARLATVYTILESGQLAYNHAQQAVALTNQPDSCNINSKDFVRRITRPQGYRSNNILDFAHPQAQWYVLQQKDPAVTINLVSNADGCEAHFDVNMKVEPLRYAMLAQDFLLLPNRCYQLSAETKSTGTTRAWVGTLTQWPGSLIAESNTWQKHHIEFRTTDQTMQERIHVLVDAGRGAFKIRNIRLSMCN